MDETFRSDVIEGYALTQPSLVLGSAMKAVELYADARVQVALSMTNRHGLIAGAARDAQGAAADGTRGTGGAGARPAGDPAPDERSTSRSPFEVRGSDRAAHPVGVRNAVREVDAGGPQPSRPRYERKPAMSIGLSALP